MTSFEHREVRVFKKRLNGQKLGWTRTADAPRRFENPRPQYALIIKSLTNVVVAPRGYKAGIGGHGFVVYPALQHPKPDIFLDNNRQEVLPAPPHTHEICAA